MDARELRWLRSHDEFTNAWFEKNFPESLRCATEELDAAQQAFGPDHPSIIRASLDLAMAHEANHQLIDSERLKQAAEDLAKRLGAAAESRPDDLSSAAWFLFEGDRWWPLVSDDDERVVRNFQRALAIRQRHLGPDHPEVADVIARLAEVHFLSGQFAEAEPLYRSALEIYEKDEAQERPYFAKTLEGLAQTLASLERHTEAIVWFERAICLAEEVGKEKRSLYFLLIFYADTLDHVGRKGEAETFRLRAREMLPKANPGEFGFQN